ncbi:MAG: hypothetical protein QXR38_03975, partial [Nitrososphaerales archaeon]
FRKKIKEIITEFEKKENLDPENDFKQALRENPKFNKFIKRKKFIIDEKQVERLQEKVLQPLKREEGVKPAELRNRIQKMAHKKVGPIRNHEGLGEFIEFIEKIKKHELPKLYTSSGSRRYNKEWIESLELENMIQVLEISAKSALMRTESRGSHYRSDYPYTDNDNWLVEIIVWQMDNELHICTRPITVTTLAPPKGVTPYMEMVKKLMEAHSEVGGHH